MKFTVHQNITQMVVTEWEVDEEIIIKHFGSLKMYSYWSERYYREDEDSPLNLKWVKEYKGKKTDVGNEKGWSQYNLPKYKSKNSDEIINERDLEIDGFSGQKLVNQFKKLLKYLRELKIYDVDGFVYDYGKYTNKKMIGPKTLTQPFENNQYIETNKDMEEIEKEENEFKSENYKSSKKDWELGSYKYVHTMYHSHFNKGLEDLLEYDQIPKNKRYEYED